jgi:hypothetical protein
MSLIHFFSQKERSHTLSSMTSLLFQILFKEKELLFFCAVQFYEFVQVSVTVFCFLLVLAEQSFCFRRVCTFQRVVTYLAVQEFLIIS